MLVWRVVLALLVAVVASGLPIAHASMGREMASHSGPLQIGPHDVPGWTVSAIPLSRRESDWRAWHDSQRGYLYFYRGSWSPLGRTGGRYERLHVENGRADTQVIILLSTFPTTAAAQHAYETILPHTTTPLTHLGAHAVEWQTTGGVASGSQGLAGYFGTFTTFARIGTVVAEIYANVGGKQGTILRPPLPDPGRAIVRHLHTVLSPPAQSLAQARSQHALRAVSVSHGLRITLGVSRRTYPRNALIRATLIVTNVSRHVIALSANNPPTAFVTDAAGTVVFDPMVPLAGAAPVTPGGPRRPPVPLRPGASRTRHLYLVLRDAFLATRIEVETHDPVLDLVGPSLALSLTESAAPSVTITAHPVLAATIAAPLHVDGPLYSVQEIVCETATDTSIWGGPGGGFTATGGTMLIADPVEPCTGTLYWYALAGWLNHPIVSIDYMS